MYRCDKCGKNSKPNEKCNITVVETRKKIYPEGSIGSEIVKEEEKRCSDCAKITD